MADRTEIAWTDATWNPVRGCTKVSSGCKNCYAETFAERWRGVPGHPYERGFDVRLVPEALELPLRWRKPRRIFVNSMSDLFHEDVTVGFIMAVFGVMACTPQHTYQVLTKRPGRMQKLLSELSWPSRHPDLAVRTCIRAGDAYHVRRGHVEYPAWPLPNVWLGVSVENQAAADERIPALLATPAAVRFLSCEPLLGPVDLRSLKVSPVCEEGCGQQPLADALQAAERCGCTVEGPEPIDWPRLGWVIVGGESGRGARPLDVAWARSLVEQCRGASVPCFVKQLGSAWARENTYPLGDGAGRDPDEWPTDLRVREWPEVHG